MNFAKITSHRAFRGATVAVAALAATGIISACGSTGGSSAPAPTKSVSLNTTAVAASIRDSIYKERGIHARVVCPPAMPQEAGRTFDCTAITLSAKRPSQVIKTPFVVTIVNSKGYVTYVGK